MTIGWDVAGPLMGALGLSLIPLAFSVARAINPNLFRPPPSSAATGRDSLGTRDAKDIFIKGLDNLGKEPTGWLFGKPSALYSNEPPPAPPPPAAAAPTTIPTAVPSPPTMPVSSSPPVESTSPAADVLGNAKDIFDGLQSVAETSAAAGASAAQATEATGGKKKGKGNRFEKRKRKSKRFKEGSGKR